MGASLLALSKSIYYCIENIVLCTNRQANFPINAQKRLVL